ncbi:FAD-binding protein [bacterium]|nr:FAD-binding protein [bacterium]
MQNISRRGLIKTAGVAVAGIGAGIGSAAVAAETTTYVPGTYTGAADGISSSVTVTITVDDTSVTDVVVDSSHETAEIGAAAQDELQAQLLAAGSDEIDGVAGATITSGAAKKAMAAALKKAKTGETAVAETAPSAAGDAPAWLGEKPVITDDMCVETVDCQLLIVGSGTAGHFAAMNAVRLGGAPLVIDKAEIGLGVRYQMGAINTKLMQSAGIQIDRNEITRDFSRYSNCWNDQQLVHLWYDNSGEVFDFYDDLCREAGLRPHLMKFATNEDNYLKGYIECNEVLKDDKLNLDPAQVIETYVEANGGTFRYNTAMVELIQDEAGAVLGVYATNEDGDYIRINAEKGVIMATGGYAHNREMMRALQPQAAKVYAGERAPITNQGDGIKACLWAGATKDDKAACMLFERAALPIGTTDVQKALEDGVSKLFWMGSQPFLTVDLNGERFCNESGLYDDRLHAIAGKGGVMIEIIDSNYYNHNVAYDTDGCSRSVPMPLWDGEEEYMSNDSTEHRFQIVLENPDYFACADTIEELAEKLGVPADNLVATVDRYNQLCEAGVDEDFGKEPFRLVPYGQPPYYGVYVSGLILCTFDGIVVNTQLQALREDGSVIDGLYCVGNDAGRYFCDSYPNLTAGAAGGKSATFGWLAAANALNS